MPEPEAPTIATDSDFLISKSIPFKMVSCPSDVLTVLPRSMALIISRISLLVVVCLLTISQASAADRSIVVYGDSISAAYGMDQHEGWVSLLADRLADTHPGYKVVNASVSGETTGGGVVRIDKTMSVHSPDIVILELGGNDGLRGYPIDKIRTNLDTIIRSAQAVQARVLLVGMVLPPNYGRRYTQAFEQAFTDLAAEHNLPFVPFLLSGVTTERDLIQGDGIHPTAEAQPKMLQDIWPALEKMIDAN